MTKIRSDSSGRVRDRRGASSGLGGGGFPLPIKAGGGIVGVIVIVVLVITQLVGGNGGSTPRLGATDTIAGSGTDSGNESDGAVACVSDIEKVVCGAVDDVSLYWEKQFPISFNGAFSGTDTVFFSGNTQTGCGNASADTGPFYCPADQLVYFDLDFLQSLQDRFGATGDLAAQYIVAHEYGHHVQNVTGISDLMRSAQERDPSLVNELSVSLELQADCFAGAWASSVAQRELFDRSGEIEEALNAAEAVGDDRILASAGQEVNPDSFTHGSAEQRREWFATGFDSGDPEQCTTFDGSLAPPA